jgi:molecular chaperone DnaK
VVTDHLVSAIPNQEGELHTPCVVAHAGGEWLIGEPARRQEIINPTGTARSFKRLLGRRGRDGTAERIRLGEASYPPQFLCALLLRKLREAAEDHLGRRARRAVLTVPASFDEGQRQALLEAASIAGLDTDWELTDPTTRQGQRCRMRLVNEPTAAVLAFALTTAYTRARRVAVLHLGGGSFDVSILDVGDGVFKVEVVAGDSGLGGDDFDAVLVEHLADQFRARHRRPLGSDPVARARLRQAAEQAKRDLSQAEHASIHLPYLADAGGPRHLKGTVTRAWLDRLTDPLLKRCRETVRRALAEARLKPGQVDEVVTVGGMTRVPAFQGLVREVFGRVVIRQLQAGELAAGGAAILGHQLQLGSRSDVLLIDVTPLALGVEDASGYFHRLIDRNSAIPRERTEELSLKVSGGVVRLRVLQDVAGPASGRRLPLGEVRLEGTRADADGTARIAVTFCLDASGILDVTCKEVAGGRAQRGRMFPSSGLSAAEVERLRREAEQERLIRNRWSSR